jgi:hypothetical protein
MTEKQKISDLELSYILMCSLSEDYVKQKLATIKKDTIITKQIEEKLYEQIKYWGNGGGMLSVENVLRDCLEQTMKLEQIIKSETGPTIGDYIKEVQSDPYYEDDTEVFFIHVLFAIFEGIDELK